MLCNTSKHYTTRRDIISAAACYAASQRCPPIDVPWIIRESSLKSVCNRSRSHLEITRGSGALASWRDGLGGFLLTSFTLSSGGREWPQYLRLILKFPAVGQDSRDTQAFRAELDVWSGDRGFSSLVAPSQVEHQSMAGLKCCRSCGGPQVTMCS